MKKIKNREIYMLAFCYAFFNFAVMMPGESKTSYDYLFVLFISMLISIVISALIYDNRRLKPIAEMFILIYLLLLIAKQINLLNNYMEMYHRNTWAFGNVLLSGLFIVMIAGIAKDNALMTGNFSFVMTAILLILILVMNTDKVNPVNLYNAPTISLNSINVDASLIEYIVPLKVCMSYSREKRKRNEISLFIMIFLAFTIITVYAFSISAGNLLYSISPLQMLFQATSGTIIKNFDGIFNLLLLFPYYSSLLLLVIAYKNIKQCFTYTNNLDLLSIIPFICLVPHIETSLWFIALLGSIAVIFAGRIKRGPYEKV